MHRSTLPLLAAALALAACGDDRAVEANDASTANAAGDTSAAGSGTQTAAASWPRGARIVEEDGVTFRIDPDGTRVRLTDNDSRILVEDGVRFRVDPDGSRVRIDERGIDVDLPIDVDVGTNAKGNLDVDVNASGGDATPDR